MESPHDLAQAQYNQGVALYETRRYAQALAHFVRAGEIDPEHLWAHWNECITRLTLGDFKNGWLLHEARWQKNEGRWERDPAKRGWRGVAQPLWLGDFSIAGKTICLWGEQGFGDMLQFCRYAPQVVALGANVFLYVREPLARLLRHSFAAQGIQVIAVGEPLPPHDAHCPMMSLPLACGTDEVSKIPASVPYIAASDDDAQHWKNRLDALVFSSAKPLRIGIAWAGLMRTPNPLAAKMDAERSIDFETLRPLFSSQGVQWLSLQKDAEAHLLASAGVTDLTAELHDWADTAALIANLDLVISCDTAVAHLAASMGKPTWILSRYVGCWRWMDHRTDSPWYPTARLFHQSTPGDWTGVVREVAGALTS